MRCLGVKVVIVTNAAGGLNPDFKIGDVMCIMDHFAPPLLAGQHPLIGPNDDALGPRFQPMSNAYTKEMQDCVVNASKVLDFGFVRPHGCYGIVSGPTYEAPTEAKWLRSVGVDSVGMSTIPELVAAHHSGMKVIGLSLITNKVVMPGDSGPAANHKEVLEVAEQRANDMQALVKEIVNQLKSKLEQIEALPPIDLSSVKALKQKKAMKKAAAKKVAKKPTRVVMKTSKAMKKKGGR
jgi:purine-nucleoside phosphorylase